MRFDRVYIRESQPSRLVPTSFNLIGIEKVPGTQSFPSDHWGILTLFEMDGQRIYININTQNISHYFVILECQKLVKSRSSLAQIISSWEKIVVEEIKRDSSVFNGLPEFSVLFMNQISELIIGYDHSTIGSGTFNDKPEKLYKSDTFI